MKRDRRLLIALMIFVISLVACVVQAWVTALYIDAAVTGNWTWFARTFSVAAPASAPEVFCFDHCAPEIPFLAGWVSIAAFTAACAMLAHAWWKPRT